MPMTILGIDPGTREMGAAVIRRSELLSFGVHTLRNGGRPYDVIGQARQIVLSYIAEYSPELVAIEKPLRMSHKRASLLSVISDELTARSRELGLQVVLLEPSAIRERLVGDPRANKLEVARVIVENGFPNLREKLPQKPKRSALGYKPGEKYWFHMFDALAAALAAQKETARRGV